MFRKMFLISLISGVGLVYAQGSTESTHAVQKKNQEPLNSPAVGSQQYSNGNFGAPKISGKAGKKYYSDKELNNPSGDAETTGRFSYSSKSTAETKLTGKAGSKYYTKDQLSDGPNQPTQGSRIGSNQVFDYPGAKSDQTNGQGAHN